MRRNLNYHAYMQDQSVEDTFKGLKRDSEELERVCRDLVASRASRARKDDEILQRIYDLRVEIRAGVGGRRLHCLRA